MFCRYNIIELYSQGIKNGTKERRSAEKTLSQFSGGGEEVEVADNQNPSLESIPNLPSP